MRSALWGTALCALGLLFGGAAAGCAESHLAQERIVLCPATVSEGFAWSGVIGLPGAATPNACLSVYADDRRVGSARATAEGSFAFAFPTRGDPAGRRFRLVLGEEALPLSITSGTAARIDYDPGTTPLTAERGWMSFDGRLTSTPDSSPIREAWMLNWSEARSAPIEPTPSLDRDFMARVIGERQDRGTVVSRHEHGEAGGCWWPGGGGGWARCSEASREAGLCGGGGPPPPCTTPRGCEEIEVEERSSGAPREPEQSFEVPVGEDGGPPEPDAGPPPLPDGGPS